MVGLDDDNDAEAWLRLRTDFGTEPNPAASLRTARDYEISVRVGDRGETVGSGELARLQRHDNERCGSISWR